MSATACTAVGDYTTVSGNLAQLVERWNGLFWELKPSLRPAGATSSQLNGVSCTTACIAVGSDYTRSGEVTLAELWNRTGRAIQTTPNPAGATYSQLSGVSCTSATACTAVGYYYVNSSHDVAMAERWNGTRWALRTPQIPAGAATSALNGVSCTSATACTAVGSYTDSVGNILTLAERWNGTSWVIQTSPNPPGATSSALNGVSCSSATACTAVGTYRTGNSPFFGSLTLAERWDGTSWTVQITPDPGLSTGSQLTGVSCTSATACTAVGYSQNFGASPPLVERWDGTSWAIETAPGPAGAFSSRLNGVSCTSATACVDVGSSDNGSILTLAEQWDGTNWTVQSTPNPIGATSGQLSGVSCTSTSACTAVGSGMAERWDGTRWAVQMPATTTGSQLSGVSCTSATTCTAVGANFSGGAIATLAERWDGTSWTIQATPNPTGAVSQLASVSCASASACIAVGESFFGLREATLSERWDGTSWTVQATPVPPGANFSQLTGVSCTSANACTAVGVYSSAGGRMPLAERWDGTSWTIQTTPNPVGAATSQVTDVSCASANACTAVGFYTNSVGNGLTLAERWDGTSWTVETTPNAAGATSSGLSSVSCASATACTAVGFSSTSGVPVTLAERWDGTSWMIQTVPNRAGRTSSELNGVACTSATACTAVGSYYNGLNVLLPLAEGYSG